MGASTYTMQPEFANISFDSGGDEVKLSANDWTQLSNDLYQGINAAIAARGTFEQNLKEWQDAYDLILGENDNPQFDGSNIRLPYTATQVESLKAYIAGTVLVPRMYVVTGRTQAASEAAFQVERFYNSELTKMRPDGSSYFEKYANMIHLGVRDGTVITEVLWNRSRKRVFAESEEPILDKNGQPKLDEKGYPIFKKVRTPVDVYDKDYAECTNVPIKDFLLIPAESPSIEDAAACARAEWLYEDQLKKMVLAGILDEDEVEAALTYVESGTTEVPSDRQGYYDKDVSQQVDPSLGQGTVSSKFFAKRGPIKVWRIHSNQYDMDGSGDPEENIFWLHEQSQRMLGWMPYDYPIERRPFFKYCPLPRPDEFYGYSLIERLAKVQSEMDLQHNTRINLQLRNLNSPVAIEYGSKIDLSKGIWYQNAVHEVEFTPNGQPKLQVIPTPDVPISGFQEEALLQHYGDNYSSLNAPAVGGQSSGARSATELRQQHQASGTRLALICNQLRITLAQIINFIHILNKTYLTDDPKSVQHTPDGAEVFTLPLEVLMQDYEIGIAGATDPLDSITRRNETISFVQQAMMFPFVQQDAGRQWYLARMLSEAWGRSDTIQIFGTKEQAVQAQQQQQQMAAKQAQEDKQMEMMLGKFKPAPKQPRPQGMMASTPKR